MCPPDLLRISLSLLLSGAVASIAPASECGGQQACPSDWVEGTQANDDGATRDYYNRAGLLSWENLLGDWADLNGDLQGNVPYASVAMVDDDTPEMIEWDVTSLVQEWVDETSPNQGFFVRLVSGGSTYRFRSREHGVAAERPQLIVTTGAGSDALAPVADTYVASSTFQGFGDADRLEVASGRNSMLRFDVTGIPAGTTVSSATLRLFVYQEFGSSEVGVFRSAQGHSEPPSDPIQGLAAATLDDAELAAHPDVYLFADFESSNWGDAWTYGSTGSTLERVTEDPARLFEPLAGTALRAQIPDGGLTGMNLGYHFLDEGFAEPDDVYFRYYLRIADDWETLDGGKLPGVAGRYGVAGWGGRPSDGTNGWSARGTFRVLPPAGNPLENRLPIGNYVYHADMTGSFGDVHLWQNDYRGYLEKNRWYCIELYAQMNTPTQNDGVLRAWVDGRLAWEKTDWRFRDVPSLLIEEVWMNVYHGGTTPIDRDVHLYVDNVVVARQYVGPARFDAIFDDGFESGAITRWTSED